MSVLQRLLWWSAPVVVSLAVLAAVILAVLAQFVLGEVVPPGSRPNGLTPVLQLGLPVALAGLTVYPTSRFLYACERAAGTPVGWPDHARHVCLLYAGLASVAYGFAQCLGVGARCHPDPMIVGAGIGVGAVAGIGADWVANRRRRRLRIRDAAA